MSTQTVVDVIVSGTTTTVVDKRVDGITTVAGASPITEVTGQRPDLGVKTCLLGGEGDILSLTNDIAQVRANLIVTGTTLTDEIGVLSGHLITTGNNLEFQLSTLSGNLIASGNNLDSLRDILSGNLITTGNTLQNIITGATGDISTITQNLISTGNNLESQILNSGDITDDISGNLITTGQTLTNNLISTGNTLQPQIDTIEGNLTTTGQTLLTTGANLQALIIDNTNNLIDTGNNLEPRINTNVANISTLNTATGVLSTATGELQEYKFNKSGGTISGSILPSSSGSFNLGSPSLTFQTGYFDDLEVGSNTLFIGGVPIKSINGGINFFDATGTTAFRDVSIRNLTVTGTETVIDVEHLAVKDNIIIINSGESGAGIGVRSGGLVIDRGTLPAADFLFNENTDRFEFNFPLAVDGNIVVTQNQTGAYASASDLIQTGVTLQNQITSNDTDITSLEVATGELKTQSNATDSNLITTGQTLISEIAIVSGIAGGSTFDALSGNLITTGQTLTSEIAIVSGLAGGSDLATLSGNLITTGQTLQAQITSNDSDISTLTSNLVTTGSRIDSVSGNLITTGQTLQTQISSNDSDIVTLTSNLRQTGVNVTNLLIETGFAILDTSGNANTISGNLISTGKYLTDEIATVSGMATGGAAADIISGDLITTGQTLTSEIGIVSGLTVTNTNNLISTGNNLQGQITSNDGQIAGIIGDLINTGQTLTTNINSVSSNLITTGQTLTSEIAIVSGIATGGSAQDFRELSGNLITTGQTLQTQITSNDGDITNLTSNLITTGQTLTSEIAIVSGLTTGSSSDPDLSGKVDTLSGNLITTGQTLTTNINSVSSNLVSTGAVVDDISGNLITTGQTLQTQITSNDSDITSLTSNLITTGQTLTTDVNTVSGLITDNDADITALKSATGVLKTSTDNNTTNLITTGSVIDDVSGNLITTGQTLQTQITSNDNDISNITSNLVTTGQTLQTQITSNDSDISTLTSNLITTGQTLTDEIAIVSGIATGGSEQDFRELSGNLITTGQTLQTQITSNDSDISTITSNLVTTGQTLTTNINTVSTNLISTGKVVDDISGNLITTGQTLQTQITSNDSDISTLTSNLVTTGQTLTTNVNTVSSNLISTGAVVDDISGNLITTGQTLQTQITSNDGDITTLTSNLVTTGQTLTTNINTVVTNLGTSGQTLQTQITSNDSDISTLTSNLGTTGQTLQTQITSNDSDIASLTTNLGTTGQTLQTQITSNDSDISTLDSTTVKLTTNQSIAGNKIFTNDVTINNLTVTGTEVIVDVENLAVRDNIIEINSGESGAGISRISGGITIDRGSATNANILYNDANDRFELNFPLAVEGALVASAANLITTGQTLTTNINTVSTNLGTSGQTLQTQITSNDSDISTLTTNLGTTGQTLQTQITSNDSDITTLTSNLVTTGQTLTTNINTVSTNLISTGKVVDDISGNLITTGQTLQTQITSNDTDITNLSSNLVTTGQTLTTNINTVATNLVTTGQTLTSEIATVSGLIPATVIDGGGTANKVPLWSDANTIGDSVISQSSSKIGIGTATPSAPLHVAVDGTSEILLERTTNIAGMPSQIRIKSVGSEWSLANNLAGNGKLSIRDVTDSRHVMVFDGEGVVTTNKLEPLNGNDSGYLGSSSKKWKQVYFGILEADTATFSGAVTANAGLNIDNINIDGTTIALSSADLTLDVAGDIILDADGGDLIFMDGAGDRGRLIFNAANPELILKSQIPNADIKFEGNHGGVGHVTALTLDMSDAGTAIFNHDIKLADNGKAIFGNSSDLQIYHSGADSYIVDSGAGDLYIRTSNELRLQDSTGTDNFLYALEGGDVRLYYDGAQKLATTSTGATVTGAFKATTILDASNSAGTSGQILTSTGSALDWKTLGEISGVDGTGTAGYLSKWTDADTIGNSVIVESSSKIGIGTTTPDNLLTLRSASQYQQDLKFTVGSTAVAGGFIGAGGASENIWMSAGAELTANSQSASGFTARNNEGGGAGKAAGIRLGDSAGTITFFTASSLTNGNTFTWDGGSETGAVMSILNDGKVGIGTTAPAYKLQIHESTSGTNYIQLTNSTTGSGSGDGLLVGVNAAEDAIFWNLENTAIRFATNGADRLAIVSDGNVGIGTTAPSAILHIKSSGTARNVFYVEASDTSHLAGIYEESDGRGALNVRNAAGTATINLDSGNDSWFTGGDFGIGVTAPVAKLHIDDSATGDNKGLYIQNTHNVDGDSAAIRFGFAGNDNANKGGIFFKRTANYGRGSLIFATENTQTNDNVDASDAKLTISADGKVGIGTDAPSNALDVQGGTTNTAIVARSTDAKAQISLVDNSTTSVGSVVIGAEGDDLFLAAGSGGAEALRIKSDGNVGIGTDAPGSKLDVIGTTTVRYAAGNFSTKRLDIQAANTSNLIQSVTNPLHIYDNSAIRICMLQGGSVGIGTAAPDNPLEVFGADSGIKISSASSNRPHLRFECGTAEKMRLSANSAYGAIGDSSDANRYMVFKDGKVGVGTTAPARLLHVYNNTASTASEIKIENAIAGYNAALQIKTTVSEWDVGSNILAAAGSFEVYERTGGSAGNRLTILSGGKVGIGTTSPDQTFQVRVAANQNLRVRADSTAVQINARNDANSADVPFYLRGSLFNFQVGKVGIGTAAPLAKLDIKGDTTTWGGMAKVYLTDTSGHSASRNWSIGNGGTGYGDLNFIVSNALNGVPADSTGTAALVIKNDGKVGIGTIAPSAPLQIYGSDNQLLKVTSTDAYAEICISDNTTTSTTSSAIGVHGNRLYLYTGGGQRLSVLGDGKVGIGTTAPAQKLHVLGDAIKFERTDNAVALQLYNNNASPADGASLGYLQFMGKDNDGTANMVYSEVRGGVHSNTNSAVSGFLSFLTTNNGTSVTEQMRIQPDGKVGIGENAPLALLHLKGGTATDEKTHILFENTAGAKKFAIGGGGDGVTNNGLGFRNVTDDTLPMIISDSGAITFNSAFTFPTADGSAGQVLQTNGSGTVTWASVTGGGGVSGSGTDNYIPRWNGTTALQDSSIVALDSGIVGIGTNAPNAAGASTNNSILSLKGKATAYGGILELINYGTSGNGQSHGVIRFLDNTAENAQIEVLRHSAADDARMDFKTRATGGSLTTRLTIADDGKVGIGTTAPSAKLHVNGAGAVHGQYLRISNGTTQTYELQPSIVGVTNNGFGIYDVTDGNYRLVIDTSGNVGIGTDMVSPTSKLHVYGNNTVSSLPNVAAQFSATGSGGLAIGDENGTDPYVGLLVSTDNFHVKTGGNNKRLTILADGKVLIGGSTALGPFGEWNWTPLLQQLGTQGIVTVRCGADVYGGAMHLASARGSNASPTIVLNGDRAGGVYYHAYDGVNFSNTPAAIECFIDGAPAADDTPGRLVFSTAPDGSNSITERQLTLRV